MVAHMGADNGQSSTEPRLAVANHDRRALPGPEFLDHLASLSEGENIAIEYLNHDGNTSIFTYSQLDQLSSKLAQHILQHINDVAVRNQVIPVILPQHPALYVSYQAVLKCGAAFCPVTPDTPEERLSFIFRDVDAKLVLCFPGQAQGLQRISSSVICLPVDLADLSPNEQTSIECGDEERRSSDVAYVMYTSGSTGKPKGVPVSHHAVTQSLLAHDEHIPSFKRFLQFAAPTFDVSLFEIFFPWYRGSTLICCEKEMLLADLPGTVNRMNVDAIELTPTLVTTLLRKRSAVPGLQTLLTIGEMLTPQVVKEFGGSNEQESMLFAMYGPTEAAIHCTIVPAMSASSPIRNIGRPLSTVTAFILNEVTNSQSPKILATNQTGELAIAGQLAGGYLHRQEQTDAGFIELPGHGIVYRTGDRAVMTSEGDLQILGRISGGQVKLRGQRVELGEVEEAALQAQGVDIAVAVVVDDKLVLFCSGDTALKTKNVETRCKAWLPRHMRPSDIVVLPEGLPRLSSGKVDRKRLEMQYSERQSETEVQSLSLGSEGGSEMTAIISDELRTTVGIHSSLWTCGLDSLRAIRIASRLRSKYPNASVSTILTADSVSDLLTILEDQKPFVETESRRNDLPQDSSRWKTAVKGAIEKLSGGIDTMQIEEILPCAPIQIAMLSETLQDPKQNMNRIVLQVDPSISLERLMKAFEVIAHNNLILKAGFIATSDSDMPFLQVIKQAPLFDKTPSLLFPLQLIPNATQHVLQVCIHHALYDGWSWDIIVKEINTLLRGEKPRQRPAFQEFVRAKEVHASMHSESDLMDWTSRLQEAEPLAFPLLQNESIVEAVTSEHVTTLSTQLEDLANAAQILRVSKPAIVHTALFLLLANLLDASRVITGLVIAGRDSAISGAEEVIGPCLSTLPSQVQLNKCKTKQELMLQVYREHMYCLRHSSTSLAQIKSALRLASDTDLFDVIFVWQESLYSRIDSNDLVFTKASHDYLKYALVVEVEPRGAVLNLKTTFDHSKISSEQIQIIHEQLDYLTSICLAVPDQPLAEIWRNSPRSLLSISITGTSQSGNMRTTATIAQIAHTQPDRIAVDFITNFEAATRSIKRQSLSYQQLYQRAQNTAKRLVDQHGLVADDIVLIQCSKSLNLYILLCATIMAGVAYLCVDPNIPDYRLREIIEQANPKFLVFEGAGSLNHANMPHRSVTTLANIVEHDSKTNSRILPKSSGSDLAYAVFTSGSTGIPKGVLITRQNLMSNIEHLADIYPHSTSSRLLQSCSPAFDVSAFEIFWTWHCGMTLCSAENDVLFRDIEKLIDAIDVTHLSMTPSVAALVNPNKVPKVQFLVCAGEPMSVKVYEAWADHGLRQGYGPSETTNICNVRSYVGGKAPTNNVGPAFPNTKIFVCSRLSTEQRAHSLEVSSFSILPQGAAGEIWIGGAQVGRGYTNSDLTCRSWLDHPLYGRLYRSGDIGRLLADGSLVVLGREDDQAKIRGQRIELNEINSKLMQSNLVTDAYTLILSDVSSRDKLVSFWARGTQCGKGEKNTIHVLYEHLRNTLPAYMIPECLIPLRGLPLTRQGKVDRRELALLHDRLTYDELAEFSGPLSSYNGQDEMTEPESQAAEVVSDISGVPLSDININASFFVYGIDSIRAIPFVQRLRQLGYHGIQVSDIMRYSSVKRLLAHATSETVKEQGQCAGTVARSSVPAHLKEVLQVRYDDSVYNTQAILPCTPLQEAMLSSGSTSSDSYLTHLTYRLALDPVRIRAAWSRIVERHELLRTVFVLTEEPEVPYVQMVLYQFDLPWTEVVKPMPNKVASPFDKPPYSLQITKTLNQDFELHLFMHHALYDAEALNNLYKEVEAICFGEDLLPAIPFSRYLDFMVNASSKRSDAFWLHALNDIKPCLLSSHVQQQKRGGTRMLTSSLASRLSYRALNSIAKSLFTTMLALLQVSLARFLCAYFRTTETCFGTVFSGRNVDVAGIDRVVGPCFNTLPTRAVMMRNTTSGDLCQKLQQFNVDVLPFQATPLRRLQKEYGPDGRSLFDVLLLLQSSTPSLNNKVWQLVDEVGQMNFPYIFEIVLDPQSDKVHVNLHTTQADDTSYAEHLLSDFLTVLENTVEHPEAPASSLTGVRLPRSESQAFGNSIPAMNGHTLLKPTMEPIQQTDVAQVVLDALAQLSRHDRSVINAQTNIFQVGLDSISAVQLASHLRSRGYRVNTGDILEEPRIQAIIELCEKREGKHAMVPSAQGFDLGAFDRKHRQEVIDSLNFREHDVEAVYPCTATQTGILSEFLNSDGCMYYNSVRLRLRSDLDLDSLHEAWAMAIARHSILRTGFVEVQDSRHPFAMVIYKNQSVDQSWFQAVNQSPVKRPKSLHDVSRPPWQISFHQAAGGTFVDLHILHALYDAQSLRHILSDIEARYYDRRLVEPPSIDKALSSIISQNQSDLDNDFWQNVKENIQSTKFPDLNVMREIQSKLHVASSTLRLFPSTLQKSCETQGCSLSIACQIAWAKLLAAYTGQQSVLFGNIVSGRSFENEELNNVVFPCINTLPVLVDVSTDTGRMLEKVQKYNSKLQKNRHIPLSKVKTMLGVEGDLFDTVLVLQRYPQVRESCKLWDIISDEASAEYVISLEIIPDSDNVRLQLTYDQKVLPIEHSEILLRQYEKVLYDVLNLENTSPEDQLLLARLAPKSQLIETEHECLHDLVLASAARNPDKIALEFVTNIEGRKVIKQTQTYQELVSKAAQVAHLLAMKGAQPGDFVAVCFEKCPEASFTILGVLMAGCTYVAIDPGAPATRKQFILEDSKCKVVLTTSATASSLAEATVTVVCMNEAGILQQHSSRPPKLSRPVTGNDICYCLYTSGTTGIPKGCLISHRSIVQSMLCFSRIFDGHWAAESRWLQFAGYHFDVSVLEHFWTWKEGLCVTVAPRDLLFEDLPGTINKLCITHLDLTPSLARLLTPELVPSLCEGVFIVGGEQVRREIVDTWGDAGCLYNFYGPSEVTPGCTVRPRVKKLVKPTNIGQLWDNVGSYVLESDSEKIVTIGGIGELCLSGVLVGEGYLNRPELTAEKFVTLKSTGERVYRSGDLVRMLFDHSFEYLGRIDDQVKLRGQRLEIGEINHVLSQCSAEFSDAATIVAKHPQQGKEQLVAFMARSKETRMLSTKPTLVHGEAAADHLSKVRRQASEKLPSYMVPTYFLAVDFLPLTVNHKVDAKLLRSLYESTPSHEVRCQQEMSASSSRIPKEQLQRLIEPIADHIGINQAGIDPTTSLLQLGIDSISVIGLSRALKTAGYAKASVALIMRRPILMDLAEALLIVKEADGHSEVQEAHDRINCFAAKHRYPICKTFQISSDELQDFAPCTPLQEGMISKLVSSNSEQLPYLTRFVYQLDSSVDLAQLSKAWDSLQAQLGILRTRFFPTEDGYAQIVLAKPPSAVKMDYGVDLIEHDPLKAVESCFRRWAQGTKQLGSHSPWQVWLTQRESGRVTFMSLFIFHGIYDGISVPLLLKALYKLYGQSEQVVVDGPQFHEALMYGPLLRKDDAADFWRANLQSVRLLNLKKQNIKTSVDISSAHCELHLEHVRKQTFAHAVTPQTIFHAAWLYTLAKHYHINPTIGIILSGRSIELENADKIIGPLFNTLPFTINRLSQTANFADLIKACHQNYVDVLPYQHTALSNIKKWIRLKSSQELFDSLFVYQGLTETHEHASQWPWTEQQTVSIADYPLNIEIEETAKAKYSITIVTADFVEEHLGETLMQSMRQILERMGESDKILLPSAFFDNSKSSAQQHTTSEISHNNGGQRFTWTTQAEIIRSELAVLAEVKESEINHDRPNIFELGLDSVDALKLAARLKNKGIRLPVSRIIQKPTVAGLMEAWSALNGSDHTADLGASEKLDKDWKAVLADNSIDVSQMEAAFPATSIQEGLLIDFEKYFHTLVYELHRDVNVGHFVAAIHQTTRNLPILRTNFVMLDDPVDGITFLQAVTRTPTGSRKAQISYKISSLHKLRVHLNNAKKNAALDRSTPSLQIAVSEDNKVYFILALSHAHYDAWSLQFVLDHIIRCYDAQPLVAVSVEATVKYEFNMRQAATASSMGTFWLEQLKEVTPTLITSARVDNAFPSRSPSSSARSSNIPGPNLIRMTSDVRLDKLRQTCKKNGVTMQSLGLTAWALTLMYIIGQLNINFGLMVSGRTSEETERLIFPTFNTVIFRPRINLNSDKEELLKQFHDLAVEVFEHQSFPLSNTLRLARSAGPELFNTLFTFQRKPQSNTKVSSILREIELEDESISPPYAVNVEMEEEDRHCCLTLATQKGIMSHEQADRVLLTLDHILEYLTAHEKPQIFTTVGEKTISICDLPGVTLFEEQHHDHEVVTPQNDKEDIVNDSWTDTEKKIRQAFSSASNVNQHEISKHTSLFHLGLDSISTIKVSKVLRDAGLKVPVSVILRHQSVQKIAAALQESTVQNAKSLHPQVSMEHSATGSALVKELEQPLSNANIVVDAVENILPATAGQIYMLDMWRASQGHLFYATFWLELQYCSRGTFESAFRTLVRRVAALRTGFLSHDGRMFQVLFKPNTQKTGPVQYEVAEHNGGLLVALHIHHALYDAVSLDLILRELRDICQRGQLEADSSLNTDFRPFVESMNNNRNQARNFWTEYLGREADLSSRTPESSAPGTFSAERTEVFIPELLRIDHLDRIARREGVSVQAIFFAVVARLYTATRSPSEAPKEDTSSASVTVGIYLANRSLDIDGITDMVAPTFNVVPLRINISGSKTADILVSARTVQKDLEEIGRRENCGVSLREIYQWTGVRLGCYVNFLKVPAGIDSDGHDDHDEGDKEVGEGEKVVIRHADGEARERARELLEGKGEADAISPLIIGGREDYTDNEAAQWCLPSLDVEAKVDEAGQLAVGMFAPEDMFGTEDVKGLMRSVRGMLEGLGNDE